jgi:hypothetical protein
MEQTVLDFKTENQKSQTVNPKWLTLTNAATLV